MLAYVFWHRPRDTGATEAYEHAHLAFHRSLAHGRPVGMCASAVFGLDRIPWLPVSGEGAAHGQDLTGAGGYEDWYLLEDFTALGVLNEAAVGHGHRSRHDEIAHRYGGGTASLYALIEGEHGAAVLSSAATAVWVERPSGSTPRPLGELLGDGVDVGHASLWRRQLVFGPAPEFCLLAENRSGSSGMTGVAPTRLPDGWSATTLERTTLWHG